MRAFFVGGHADGRWIDVTAAPTVIVPKLGPRGFVPEMYRLRYVVRDPEIPQPPEDPPHPEGGVSHIVCVHEERA